MITVLAKTTNNLTDRQVSVYPEGPAIGRLNTGFLGFPLSSSRF
jgi:hypothetical protein